MRITEEEELDFYSLHQNAFINNYACIKDKYGNKFIQNDKFNLFDVTTNTTYFVFNSHYDQAVENIGYWLTSNGQVVRVEYADYNNMGFINHREDFKFFKSVKIFINNQTHHDLSSRDEFKVYDSPPFYWEGPIGGNQGKNPFDQGTFHYSIYVKEGVAYATSRYTSGFGVNTFGLAKLVPTENKDTIFDSLGKNILNYSGNYAYSYNDDFLEDYGIIIILVNSDVYYIKDAFNFISNKPVTPKLLLSDAFLEIVNIEGWESDRMGHGQINVIAKYSLSGKENYDFVVEEIDGQMEIKAYITGTYVASETTSITLQPINR
jgi:hypothetical protein